jgi:hypothetical protein
VLSGRAYYVWESQILTGLLSIRNTKINSTKYNVTQSSCLLLYVCNLLIFLSLKASMWFLSSCRRVGKVSTASKFVTWIAGPALYPLTSPSQGDYNLHIIIGAVILLNLQKCCISLGYNKMCMKSLM